MTKPISSDRGLARAIGVSPTTIADWRDKFPTDHPKGYDVGEWQKFMEEQGLGMAGNRVSEDREHWLTQQAEYKAKLLEIDHKKAVGDIVMKTELDLRDVKIAMAQKSALYDVFTTELPVKSEGKTAAEIRAMNRNACDRVCAIMQERLGEWATKPDEE